MTKPRVQWVLSIGTTYSAPMTRHAIGIQTGHPAQPVPYESTTTGVKKRICFYQPSERHRRHPPGDEDPYPSVLNRYHTTPARLWWPCLIPSRLQTPSMHVNSSLAKMSRLRLLSKTQFGICSTAGYDLLQGPTRRLVNAFESVGLAPRRLVLRSNTIGQRP